MSIFELSKNPLATLLLALMALAMLSACETTEEEPMIENPCGCPDGDVVCKERCIRETIP